ncbi:hypothetical protein [Parvularcula dongshanensis]|uniref:Uncharacterized protein n=1 Tax=Parvularcula dongshanensis TaxID=1173995 RepID=A0A840I3I1_9PROT|nr:hypothetical protein [Parvularcula dongshanensis]MBB4658738.1 hypothetical protein [Parvularcula dongshanensis]
MKILKASLVFLLALGLCIWSASQGVLPVGDVGHDLAVGIAGTVGLALATVFRVLATVLIPLLAVLRVLAAPIALGGLLYLLIRSARRA